MLRHILLIVTYFTALIHLPAQELQIHALIDWKRKVEKTNPNKPQFHHVHAFCISSDAQADPLILIHALC